MYVVHFILFYFIFWEKITFFFLKKMHFYKHFSIDFKNSGNGSDRFLPPLPSLRALLSVICILRFTAATTRWCCGFRSCSTGSRSLSTSNPARTCPCAKCRPCTSNKTARSTLSTCADRRLASPCTRTLCGSASPAYPRRCGCRCASTDWAPNSSWVSGTAEKREGRRSNDKKRKL